MSSEMRISAHCAACLYRKQADSVSDPEYLRRVREIIDNRQPDDCAPYMVYRFNRLQEEMFGKPAVGFGPMKRKYNELALSLTDELTRRIEASPDPLATAFLFARIGNYIDFSALKNVEEAVFLHLFDDAALSERDLAVFASFTAQCEKAQSFLLAADNCGEIVLDRLFLEQLKKRYPHLQLTVLVRGGEAQNDATVEDAEIAGIGAVARIVGNGLPIAATVYPLLSEEARACVDSADVILAKGQANYESMSGTGLHVFFAFLCKCDYFTERFGVPQFTGMLIEEGGR